MTDNGGATWDTLFTAFLHVPSLHCAREGEGYTTSNGCTGRARMYLPVSLHETAGSCPLPLTKNIFDLHSGPILVRSHAFDIS